MFLFNSKTFKVVKLYSAIILLTKQFINLLITLDKTYIKLTTFLFHLKLKLLI